MGKPPAGGRGRVDLSKALFYGVLSCGLFGLVFFWGLQAGSKKTAAYRFVQAVQERVAGSLKITAKEATTLTGIRPDHFLQPSRDDRSGVTVNDPSNNPEDLILVAGFFSYTNELRLIRRNGDVVARWPVRYYTIFPDGNPFPADLAPVTDWNIDTHGALALPDGSVVFNFEWGGLVKLDRCGRVVWKVARQTHHSVELAEEGGFWVPGRRVVEGPTPFPPFETPFSEDTLLRVSDDGKVLAEYSAPKILYDNGMEAIVTATGYGFEAGMDWDHEIVHLNKIDELTSDLAAGFPMFEAGDLALSIRELNLVMVVDKEATKVKWWQIGPWLRQHDPEFRRGGTIVVFNNNIYESVFGTSDQVTPASTPRVSNIVEIDPASRRSRVLFGGRKGQELLSVIRGAVDVTPRGGLLIVEHEGGRVLETDPAGKIVWEYISRYSKKDIAEITGARLYPQGYFKVKDWACRYAGT